MHPDVAPAKAFTRERLFEAIARAGPPRVELVHDAAWATWAAARAELFEYLEVFYNGQRRHSSLGYLSPGAFERQRVERRAAV